MAENRKFKLESLIPEPNILYSVKYEGESINEFQKLYKKLDDPLWLYSFFKANLNDLNTDAWGGISIGNAVRDTRIQAKAMKKAIFEITDGKNNDYSNLSEYFMPLFNSGKDKYKKLEWDKGKGLLNHNWLRIYAIRCSKNTFLITGGGIKLTRDMSPPHLEEELLKLDKAETYLRSGEDDQIDPEYLDF